MVNLMLTRYSLPIEQVNKVEDLCWGPIINIDARINGYIPLVRLRS